MAVSRCCLSSQPGLLHSKTDLPDCLQPPKVHLSFPACPLLVGVLTDAQTGVFPCTLGTCEAEGRGPLAGILDGASVPTLLVALRPALLSSCRLSPEASGILFLC